MAYMGRQTRWRTERRSWRSLYRPNWKDQWSIRWTNRVPFSTKIETRAMKLTNELSIASPIRALPKIWSSNWADQQPAKAPWDIQGLATLGLQRSTRDWYPWASLDLNQQTFPNTGKNQFREEGRITIFCQACQKESPEASTQRLSTLFKTYIKLPIPKSMIFQWALQILKRFSLMTQHPKVSRSRMLSTKSSKWIKKTIDPYATIPNLLTLREVTVDWGPLSKTVKALKWSCASSVIVASNYLSK